MEVLVTVGMSRFPFDRLIEAVAPLTAEHDVFAQVGPARPPPGLPHARFLPFHELQARIGAADVLITHAGNTVRLAQRRGKIPIAVARRASLGEMANDHQVDYLRAEERTGGVVALWNLAELPDAVRAHPRIEPNLLAARPVPPPADGASAAGLLDSFVFPPDSSPFQRHPIRRYVYAFDRLAGRTGCHLDLGCGTGEFLAALASRSGLDCVGTDAHAGYLAELVCLHPGLASRQVTSDGSIPFSDASFDSVSALDVLEHVGDEDRLLSELRRVLVPGGLLVLSVPRRHLFSFLDPDNAKYRLPRLHRAVYSARFGADVYRERFVDLSDGLRGDIAAERGEHTNYVREELEARLRANGLRVVHAGGSNLFWRLVHTPALLARGRLRRICERLIELDGRAFSRANLFLTAIREEDP